MTAQSGASSKKSGNTSGGISNIADEVERRLAEKDASADPWLGSPLPWREFFTHPQHMAFPVLSPKQIEFCAAGLPEDPKKTFDRDSRQYDLLVGLVGKGGGKDSMAVMIALYIVYVLLHLRNPFGFAYGASVEGEPIDILIVAPRGKTSEKVTYEKLKQRVLHWKWLKDKFRVRQSGRELMGSDRIFEEDAVEIGTTGVVFPGNIRIFALNSSMETAEGFNTLVFICTEFAAFVNSEDRPNADKILSVLESSAKTRFPGRFLGMLISYPRYKGDAIMKKYKEAATNKRIYPLKATSWEFNPMLRAADYASDLNSDNPAKKLDAQTKYLCDPGDRVTRFIGLPERVSACVNKDRPPIAELEPFVEEVNGVKMRRMRITKFNIPRQPDVRKYVARVDLGKTHDRAALCISHQEGERIIQDLLVHWIPDEKERIVVDVDDPANIILDLKRRLINILYVTYDQWNSASSINRLNRARIETDLLSLGAKEYQLFLHGLYSRAYDLLDFRALVHEDDGELAHLNIDAATGKVDHEDGYHNDLTEASCGAFAMLKGVKKNIQDIGAGLANIKPNLHTVGSDVWSDSPPDEDPIEADDDLFSGEGFSIKLR